VPDPAGNGLFGRILAAGDPSGNAGVAADRRVPRRAGAPGPAVAARARHGGRAAHTRRVDPVFAGLDHGTLADALRAVRAFTGPGRVSRLCRPESGEFWLTWRL
jgi:hypothetical protein